MIKIINLLYKTFDVHKNRNTYFVMKVRTDARADFNYSSCLGSVRRSKQWSIRFCGGLLNIQSIQMQSMKYGLYLLLPLVIIMQMYPAIYYSIVTVLTSKSETITWGVYLSKIVQRNGRNYSLFKRCTIISKSDTTYMNNILVE